MKSDDKLLVTLGAAVASLALLASYAEFGWGSDRASLVWGRVFGLVAGLGCAIMAGGFSRLPYVDPTSLMPDERGALRRLLRASRLAVTACVVGLLGALIPPIIRVFDNRPVGLAGHAVIVAGVILALGGGGAVLRWRVAYRAFAMRMHSPPARGPDRTGPRA